MKKVAHTPAPWMQRETGMSYNPSGEKTSISISITQEGDDGFYCKSIANVKSKDGGDTDICKFDMEQCTANAKLIVKAVNSFDEMKEIITEYNKDLNGQRAQGRLNADGLEWHDKIKNLLQKLD